MAEDRGIGNRKFLHSSDEICAVMPIPLAEPIPLDEGFVAMSLSAIDHDLSTALREAPLEFIETEEFGEKGSGRVADLSEVNGFFEYARMRSSIIVRTVDAESWRPPAALAAAHVARLNVEVATEQSVLDPNLGKERPSQAGIDESILSNLFGSSVLTVLEVVVPLNLYGVLPESTDELLALDVGSDSVPIRFEAIGTSNAASRLSAALNVAVSDVRHALSAYHSVTLDPISMPTREKLPPVLPVVLRKFEPSVDGWKHSLINILANPVIRPHVRPERLPTEDQRAVFGSILRRGNEGSFESFTDLRREAGVALYRNGDFRVGVILAGVAAESLLDELLMHLFWEEGARPEDAASSWKAHIASRVKSEFHVRLGGRWSLDGPGDVPLWYRELAALRNRVVHGAYVPTRNEANLAFSRLEGLVKFIGSTMTSTRNVRKYPITAWLLSTNSGFEVEPIDSKVTGRTIEMPYSLDWVAISRRWREAFRRTVRDEEDPRHPTEAGSALLLVVDVRGARWCLHDRPSAKAVPIAPPVDALSEEQLESAQYFTERYGTEGASVASGVSAEFEVRGDFNGWSLLSEWVEEYRLVPLLNVMVDGSDFDTDPE